MSRISLKSRKEIPLKIYNININKEKNLKKFENRNSNRKTKPNIYFNDDLISNKQLFETKREIKMKRFLTDKKLSRLNYKELSQYIDLIHQVI